MKTTIALVIVGLACLVIAFYRYRQTSWIPGRRGQQGDCMDTRGSHLKIRQVR